MLHALAAHTRIDLYLHSPTDQFWADLVSQKTLARKRLEQPEAAELWETGNSLLASWGRQGQALQDLLLMQEIPATEEDAFSAPETESLLAHLQRDIYTLRPMAAPGERMAVEPDASLQVHVCHSPQRECQVLHDGLLAMLDGDPALRPEDMLVMVPEISLYAPYIEAVFEQDAESERPFIPWNLSDISLRDEHPLVRVFLQLLDLPHSRFSHTEILSCLDVPELAGRFGLDGEALAQIREWLAEAQAALGIERCAQAAVRPARHGGEHLGAGRTTPVRRLRPGRGRAVRRHRPDRRRGWRPGRATRPVLAAAVLSHRVCRAPAPPAPRRRVAGMSGPPAR